MAPGGLLHHPFTLTPCGAVYSLWHFLADHSGWVLPTALPCGARTFLGAVSRHAAVQPTHSQLQSMFSGCDGPQLLLRRLRDPQIEGHIDRERTEQARRRDVCGFLYSRGRRIRMLQRDVQDDLIVQEEGQMRRTRERA